MPFNKTFIASIILLTLSGCHDEHSTQKTDISNHKPQQDNKPLVDLPLTKPIFNAIDTLTGTTGLPLHGQITATAKQGDSIVYSLSGNPSWLTIDPKTGQLSGTPGRNDNGKYTVTVTATNDSAVSHTQIHISISNSNHAPTIAPLTAQTIVVNTPFTVSVSAYDKDNNYLTYSLINTAAWANIDAKTGVITGKPTAVGQYPLNIEVSDGYAKTTAQVVVHVVVDPTPIITVPATLTGETRKAFSTQISATDPNGKKLTYSVSSNPAWLTINSTTGQLSGTPGRDDNGEFTVMVIATNGNESTTASIKITISQSNVAPIITPIVPQIINANTPYQYTVKAQDDNNDHLTYSLSGQPPYMVIDAETGQITANANDDDEGNFSVTVDVSDGQHHTTETVKFTVNIDPVIKAIKHQDASLATYEQYVDFINRKSKIIDAHKLDINDQITQSVDTFNWNPSHDSVLLTSINPTNSVVLLGNNNQGTANLAIASELGGQRFIVTSGNIVETENNRGSGDSNIATGELSKLAKNMLTWLANKDVSQRINIVTLNTSNNNYWHETYNWLSKWLQKNYKDTNNKPTFTLNEHGACDGDKLQSCIETNKPDVVVMSSSDVNNVVQYINNLKYLIKNKVPVLFINSERNPSYALKEALKLKQISANSNYWSQWQVTDFDYGKQKDQLSKVNNGLKLINDINDNNTDITPEILNSCAKSGNYLLSCGGDVAKPFMTTDVKKGIDFYHNLFKGLDENGVDVFSDRSFDIYSAVLLAADTKRSEIDYPVQNIHLDELASAMFADSAISYKRAKNIAQPDLGSFVKDRSQIAAGVNDSFAFPATVDDAKTFTVPFKNQWTTTGWFILPGKTVTLTRTDNDKDTTVKLRMNIQLPNTNRGYQRGQLERPLELMQDRLTIKAGQTITFSSPYGGPLYFDIGSRTKNEDLSASFAIKNIAHHPTITNFDDDVQIRQFKQLLDSTELPYVDLKTEAAELHARKDRFLESINDDYPTIKSLLHGIMTDHLESLYGLSGFTISQKPLNEQLPAYTATICQNLFGADDCFDKTLNKRYLIQHEAYDQNAQCGVGCSGNPFTSFSGIYPSGWLVNHELGHNLQRYRLSVAYTEGPSTRNDWTTYGSRSGENSNNIFPYYAKWRAYYETNGKRGTITDVHMNQRDLFAVYMSDALDLKDSTNSHRMVYDANCNALDADTSGDVTRFVGPWESNAYAIYNGYRMEFYIQAALRADKQIMSDGTRLGNGFGLFTLMYQHERIFSKYIASEELWNAHKDDLGFSLFKYKPTEAKGGTIDKISGNDFMLISMSKITGKDWTPYFDMFGLYYSDLAAQQVVANSDTEKVEKGMYVLDNDMPNENISEGLPWISFEGDISTLVWPRGDWSPKQCVKS